MDDYDYDKFLEDSSDDYPKYGDVVNEKEWQTDERDLANQQHQETQDVIEKIMADRKKMREELKETIILHNPDALFADGFDDCIAGFDTKGRAIYFADAIVQTLINRDGMSEEEALEFFGFNIECAHVGEFTPIYMWED